VGVTLKVTPHIHDGTVVRLEVEQEVSSVVPTDTQASAAFSDIVTNKRTIETTILADDGQTIVLGGLIQDDITEVERRVPLLGDIPYIGQLFSNNDDRRTKRNLLVFLRPTVLRDGEEVARLTDEKQETMRRQSEMEAGAPTRRELYEGRELPDRPLGEAAP
jgi:general secretion pathway protein D